uniref:Undecaprenyl-diphosphatase n=1 Tax=Thermodesulfobacterium geofontis TaxID=1295609 RepID=A0A7V4JP62_9BACT
MDFFEAFFLGLIQGLTEFLPISSTGHLILIQKIFNTFSSLSFDAFIHLGSFFAIVSYFWKDLKEIWGYKWFILISALPGAIAGLTLESIVENYLRTPLIVGLVLIIMSIPMILGEILGKKNSEIKDLNFLKAFLIGIFQALSLIPGTSRSGITISAGLLLGLKREVSAQYSFLVGSPLILGAGVYEGIKLFKSSFIPFDLALVGFFSSALFSFLAIAFLIPFLKRYSLYSFVIYRILLGLLIIIFYLRSGK